MYYSMGKLVQVPTKTFLEYQKFFFFFFEGRVLEVNLLLSSKFERGMLRGHFLTHNL